MIAPFTDASLPAVLQQIERQLQSADIVTLTRAQIATLLHELVPPKPATQGD